MRILLVEDEAIVRFYLKMTLAKINGEIIDAKSAEEAVKLIDSGEHFDLIITDINMQDMDGFDLIDEVDKRGLGTAVVVESAYLANNPRMAKYKDRVIAFIKKPIDLNIMESIIRQIESNRSHSPQS